ncbi:MAG TPA: MBL fold metallo-hydrolase [Methylotenera sp.]|nr:MBL fold metallo-hydrolase [Methylotenera sp.]
MNKSFSSHHRKSDHFNGKRFFNPTHQKDHTLSELMRFLISYRPKPWPKEVINEKDLNLHQNLSDNEVAITFVNHATLLIQVNGANILTDPVWSERASPLSFAGPKRARQPGIEINDLPKIDFVLVSHNHYDHMDLATLKLLNERFSPTFLVALGDRKKLEKLGAKHVVEMDWWQKFEVSSELEFIFTPTQHFSGRTPFTFSKSLWGAFVIKSKGHQIYFGGDAAYSTQFTETSNRLGQMDLSLIPIGAYEPRWFMKSVHMNPEEAVQAHLDLKSKRSIGIHFGTFQLTEEKIDQPVIDLQIAMTSRGLNNDDFNTLKEGQTEKFVFGFSSCC